MEQRIRERIRREFQGADQNCVVELLASYSGPEGDRVRRDILELSKGELEKIGQFVKAAQTDYRDIFIGPSITRTIRCCVVATQNRWLMKLFPNGEKRVNEE